MHGTTHAVRVILLAALVLSIVPLEFARDCLSVGAVFSSVLARSPSSALQLIARVDKSSFRENDTIELKVSLKNGTRRVVYVTESNVLADYKIEIRNENGRLMPPTEDGGKLLRLSAWSTRRLSVAINPGQEINQTFEVNKIYAMPPGIYSITVKRRVTTEWRKKNVELTSNVVIVRVIG